jgi:RES domain
LPPWGDRHRVTLTVNRPDGTVHRVGFQPDPWAWTPWQYGPFTGRWDDPEDLYRVLYAASSTLGCFLEVLAVFRPDPAVADALARIEGDEMEDSSFGAAQPGKLDRSWLTNRRLGTARLGEDYVDVGHSQTIAHLRPHFIERARELGLPDFDAAAIRMSAPRILTQEISRSSTGRPSPTAPRQPVSSSAPVTETTNSYGQYSSATPTSGKTGATCSLSAPRPRLTRMIRIYARQCGFTTLIGLMASRR